MNSLAQHWDTKYESSEYSKLGWYESSPSSSLGMIEEASIDKESSIFISGAGASYFIDKVLQNGFNNVTVVDISSSAIEQVKSRLGKERDKVKWLVGDVLDDAIIDQIEPIDYWHDRAVLHFFTEEKDRQKYFGTINDKLKKGGFVMLAQFDINEDAKMCSNLPVHRYSVEMYEQGLGEGFKTIKSFHEIYSMPSGDFRNYLYALLRKA